MNFDAFEGGDFTFAVWCSGCNSEQAVDTIEVFVNEQWVELKVGSQCLTTLRKQGKIEM